MSRWSSLGAAVLFLVLSLPTSGWPAASEGKAAAGQQATTGSGTSLMDSLSFTSRKEPIHIRSRELEFFYNDKRIVYRGDVVAIQGETTLKSDTMTVIYQEPTPEKDPAQPEPQNPAPTKGAAQPKSANAAPTKGTGQLKPQDTSSQQQLKEIVAEGNVDITSGDRHATAKKAVFTQATRTVVLSGNAILQEGENRVNGEKVTVYLDEKRTLVDGGGKKQVEMWVMPKQQEEGKKGEKTP
ncbi:MAG: hypothetical protein HY268_31185 [Deltaproteobacteria bacterium]|nr:hypothetical protein [Deltaproteobacteria bacterium]